MTRFFALLAATALFVMTIGACSTTPKSSSDRAELEQKANHAVELAQNNNPELNRILHDAAGYAVFPSVGKGAVGVGGAYGKGVLYQNGAPVGYCDLSQATVGLQLGGQAYSEVICFEDHNALNRFKNGDLAFDAQASAVALKSGETVNAKYRDGVCVFTTDEAGLMYEASIGGQKFRYQSRENYNRDSYSRAD